MIEAYYFAMGFIVCMGLCFLSSPRAEKDEINEQLKEIFKRDRKG